LHVLWDRLDIGDSERVNFTTGKEGVKDPVVVALEEEISRCEKLKLENIQRFVEGMRKELYVFNLTTSSSCSCSNSSVNLLDLKAEKAPLCC
jgi:hypothetical protein